MVALETPPLAPASRTTLLDVASVSTDAPGYSLQNPLKYQPHIMDGGNRDAPTGDAKKVFDKRAAEDLETKVFTAYRGLDESLLNGPGFGQAELEKLFVAGEPLYVERKVQQVLLNDLAVDITPTQGTPLTNAKAALGLLEQWIAERYLFQPSLSGNMLATNLIQPGIPYITETSHGAPIASAAGYQPAGPGGQVAGPGEAWLYIHGQINIWTRPAAVLSGARYEQNRDLSLVEKSYAVSVDGPVAAILIGY